MDRGAWQASRWGPQDLDMTEVPYHHNLLSHKFIEIKF